MLSAGQLIWASCRPLIRLMLCVAGGFVLTKTDNFPPVAARGAGQIALNIALPCLMFSKIVPAFTSDNISALGPLVLVALLYEAIGFLMALVIKQFFWVPHRFRYGFLVAGGWGNVGDIPTSVVVSVTGAAPFNGTADQNLSIAYISAFILIFMMTLFPLGGNRLVAMDFVGPDVEPEEVKEAVRRRRRAILYALPNAFYSKLTRRRRRSSETEDATQVKDEKSTTRSSPRPDDIESNPHTHDISTDHNTTHSQCLATALTTPTPRHVSFRHDVASTHGDGVRSHIHSPTPTEVGFSAVTSPDPTVVGGEVHAPNDHEKAKEHGPTDPSHLSSPATPTLFTHISQFLKKFLSSLITPASLSILLSFPIALIPPLKGLFVALPASDSPSAFTNPHISPAPDGLPPLSVILDTATFVGAASVPLGLICLGSALARLKVPRNQWSTLPTGAIASLAIGKMLIAPILGVGIVQGLVKCGLIGKEDKLLQFVCIFFSCLPTATTQVYLTQVFSGTGSAEHLPAFLIPQYTLMFISMTALTAYTLQSLF